MGIGVLGPLTVEGNGVTLGHRDRVVLSALAISQGAPVSGGRLADALWGDDAPASASKVVQGCVVRLRKLVGAGAIETTASGYRLTLPLDDVDAHRFERLLRRGRESLALGDAERAFHAVGEALTLWRGPALVDLEDWDDGRVEASRLERLRCDAEELRLDAALRAGRHRDVLADLQTGVEEQPLRERRWALLALALYRAGRQADALRTLDRAKRVLVDEAGLDPGFDLRLLEQAILDQDPVLADVVAPPDDLATCPYLGLVPYDVADADAFFGREQVVARCQDVLRETGVLAVLGPSGSGKSSLVRAGVAAAFRRDGCGVTITTPGSQPLASIGDLDSSTVLIVDQCEEVVTAFDDPAERNSFLASVTERAERGSVVVALRADRLGDLTDHPAFARLVERGLVLLGPPDEDELRAIVRCPAEQAGLLIEPGLIEILVREVEGEPGALPLLSHALRATWERREGRVLTVAGYHDSGGIRGAVAQTAEGLYEQATADEQSAIREVMLRLVIISDEGEPVRCRVARMTIAGNPAREKLLERLVGARLVTSGEAGVELAHEALARVWPRLRGWLDEDIEGQRVRRHLAVSAAAWEAMGRPAGELYRGQRLDQAAAWREHAHRELTDVEQAFLDASTRDADAERRAATERAQHQLRVNRRLRGLLTGVGVLLVAALVAGVLAFRQADRADTAAETAAEQAGRADAEAAVARQEAVRADSAAADARREAQRADAAALSADARRISAQALIAPDTDHALLLAVEAARLEDSADSRASLLTVLQRTPSLIRVHRTEGPAVAIDVSPDGTTAAVGTEFGDVTLHDTSTWAPLGSFDAVPPRDITFHPDGSQLAVARESTTPGEPELTWDPRPVRMVDVPSGRPAPGQPGGAGAQTLWPRSPVFSADGATFAVVLDGRPGVGGSVVDVWDTAALNAPRRSVAVAAVVDSVALSADGRRVYVGSTGPPAITVYDVATGAELRSAVLPGAQLESSPDGTMLAVVDGTEVVLVDAASLAVRQRMRGHTDAIHDLRFSHDGASLASAAADHTAAVWDVATGERLQVLGGHDGTVASVAFSPDDRTVYTAGHDHRVLTWDLSGSERFVRRLDVASSIEATLGWIVPSPNGERIAYVTFPDGPLEVVDVATGRVTGAIDAGHGGWGAVAWRGDGGRLATTGTDGAVRVWDPTTGALVTEGRVAGGHIGGIGYTDGGRRLMIAARRGVVSTIDADTMKVVGPRINIGGRPVFAFANPVDDTAMVFTYRGGALVVDLSAGSVIARRTLDHEANIGGFSPDGRSFVLPGRDGRMTLLDAHTAAPVTDRVAHSDQAVHAAFAPDGSTFVSSGLDGRVNLWDGTKGTLLASVMPAGPDVYVAAQYTPDSESVVIAARDGAMYEWDLDVASWMEAACDVAGRALDEREWREAFPDRPYRPACPG